MPYYGQFMPTLNLLKGRKGPLSELITQTLELMEKLGGGDSYLAIKRLVPTYESCVFS